MNPDLKTLFRASVALTQGARADRAAGLTHFGGQPDVPSDFVWPTNTGPDKRNCGPVSERPLSFLFQIDLAAAAPFDTEGLLPHTGLLSFFYDLGAEAWGYELGEEGAYRVFWFEKKDDLHTADFPAALDEQDRFPCILFTPSASQTLPDFDDYSLGQAPDWRLCEAFEAEKEALGCPRLDHSFRMLGWADEVQGNSTRGCELLSRKLEPYAYMNLSEAEKHAVNEAAKTRWALLLQFDWLRDGDFTFMIGDCGRLYWYIPFEDLKARRFDCVQIAMQCY